MEGNEVLATWVDLWEDHHQSNPEMPLERFIGLYCHGAPEKLRERFRRIVGRLDRINRLLDQLTAHELPQEENQLKKHF